MQVISVATELAVILGKPTFPVVSANLNGA